MPIALKKRIKTPNPQKTSRFSVEISEVREMQHMKTVFTDFLSNARDDDRGSVAQDVKKWLKPIVKPFGPKSPIYSTSV